VASDEDPAGMERPEPPDLPEGAGMIDEEAIEQFGRELDDLGEAEAATMALEEDEAADAAASPAPPVPF